jgi:hypothetical protein
MFALARFRCSQGRRYHLIEWVNPAVTLRDREGHFTVAGFRFVDPVSAGCHRGRPVSSSFRDGAQRNDSQLDKMSSRRNAPNNREPGQQLRYLRGMQNPTPVRCSAVLRPAPRLARKGVPPFRISERARERVQARHEAVLSVRRRREQVVPGRQPRKRKEPHHGKRTRICH